MESHGIKGHYTVIPNVVKTDLFSPGKSAKETPFTFIHVSDFSPNKNIPLLLEAFAEVAVKQPGVKLHLAGNGDHFALRQLVKSLHLRPRQIDITGPHDPMEIAKLLRQSDVFVLCSTLETQSLVLIEAQLSGLPCLSSRSGGPTDILDHSDTGILFPVGDKKSLVNAMLEEVRRGPAPESKRLEISESVRLKFGSTASQLQQLYLSILP